MATLVLGAVGSYFAGPIGGFIGAGLGSIIDSQLLYPALFPQPGVKGPRIEDLQIQSGSEGTPMQYVLGPRNRVSGCIVWMTDLIEKENKQRAGGKGGGGSSVTSYTYSIDLFIVVADTSITPVRQIKKIWANSKLIYGGEDDGSRYTAVRFRYGDEVDPDPLIEARMGVGKVPLFKKCCGVIFEGLQLADFGNQPPNITMEVEQDPDMSVAEALTEILKRYRFTDDEWDVTRIGTCFEGYTVSGPQPGDTVLEPVMLGYSLGVQENGDKLVFFPFGAESEFTVLEEHLAAHEPGGSPPRKLEISDKNNYEIPAEVNTKFFNIDNDMQQGSSRARRIGHRSNQTVTIDLPLSLTMEEGNAISERALRIGEQERQTVRFTLSSYYMFLQENDIVNVEIDGVPHRIRIANISRGSNWELQVTGIISWPEPYQQAGVGVVFSDSDSTETAPETVGYLLDCPALLDEHTSQLGYYAAMCNRDPNATWRGGRLFTSPDDTDYVERASMPIEATIGRTLNGARSGTTTGFDTANHIDVELNHGTLTSVTDDSCIAGQNRCAVKTLAGEWEIIGFATVTSIGANRYRLSRLLRGQRGTEHLVGRHAAGGAPFVFLSNDGSIVWWQRGLSDVGAEIFYKTPSLGGDLDDYPAQRITLRGITERPFSVENLAGNFSSDDLNLTWDRRTKRFLGPTPPDPLPFTPDEVPEAYDLEFHAGGSLSPVLRTVRVAGATSYTYTSSDRTSDGFVSGAPVNVSVYQLSYEVGRSPVTTSMFTPP